MGNTMPVEFRLTASNSDYDPGDDRWLDQVAQLIEDLNDTADEVRKDTTPVAGRKGGEVEAIILALGSAGAISAAVEIFKAWLARDQKREIEISVQSGDDTKTVRVSANRMDTDTVTTFMEHALKKLSK